MEGYPTDDLPDLHRILRHRLRDRFRPRHLRHHQGTPHRPNLKCLRHPRSAGTLLSARRCSGQVPLPQVWARFGSYVRRPKDGLAERSVWWEIPDRLVPGHHHRVGGRLHCPLPHAASEKIHKLILPPFQLSPLSSHSKPDLPSYRFRPRLQQWHQLFIQIPQPLIMHQESLVHFC